jgi:hypothetical protein
MTLRTSPNSPIGNSAIMLADTTEQVAFRGIAAFVRPGNATPYDVGGVVGSADGAVHRLPSIGQAGAHYEIQSVQISMSGTALPSGMGGGFRVHFYTAKPAAAADASTYANAVFDRRIYVGYIDVSTLELIGGGFLTKTNNTDRLRFQSLTNDIWAEIVTLASNGFTPVSGAQVELNVRGAVIGKPSSTAGSPLWLPVIDYRKAEDLPEVSWWFAEDRSLTDRIRGLTLDFTRTTPRTFEQADGSWGKVGINEPAFGYLNGVSAGLHLTEGRTNLFLGSAAPATQDCTVTAVAHALTFKGTGSITLTGASTAGPLGGTGANDRVELGFTPTAGTLTLALSGDVREVQLEAGFAASPYIETGTLPTAATTGVCRTTDLSWYDPAGGVFYVEAIAGPIPSGWFPRFFELHDGTNNIIRLTRYGNGTVRAGVIAGGSSQAVFDNATVAAGSLVKCAYLIEADNIGLSVNNATVTSDTSAIIPTVNTLRIGADALGAAGSHLNSTIARLDYYPPGAAQSFIQRMTS